MRAILQGTWLVFAAVLLLLMPFPWPLATPITTVSTRDSTIEFYFRPAGAMGAIMGDNPWVYARITDMASKRSHVINVWGDTPCDGVERLVRQMGIPKPRCYDSELLTFIGQ